MNGDVEGKGVIGDPRRVVEIKRDGGSLAPADIEAFVQGYLAGEVTDPLAAAFLMAALLRGLDPEETLALTRSMIDSGETLAFPDLGGPIVDKHSTGGVADGVTLIFAPLAASVGLRVAKLSGRGLGHTGGTLDKLGSIPGMRTDLLSTEIERQVRTVGCVVAAQSPAIVPADGALYSLRDATATIPSIPLIAASVMSKKLAVASDLIVVDVKAGSGAFMKTIHAAQELALACLALARSMGRATCVAVTDMSQPLGDAVGNALDVAEAINVLKGESTGRLRDLSVAFAAAAIERTAGGSQADAEARARAAIDGGDALERFRRMVEAQGGDPAVVDDPASVLPRAPVVTPIVSDRQGVVAGIETEAIGLASGTLGARRPHGGGPIDPAVGIVVHPKVGDGMEMGEPIGEVHARDAADAERAARATLDAITVTDGPVTIPPLVHMWFG